MASRPPVEPGGTASDPGPTNALKVRDAIVPVPETVTAETNPHFSGKRIPLQQQVRLCEVKWAEEICDNALMTKHPIELLLAGDICGELFCLPSFPPTFSAARLCLASRHFPWMR
jgi:hypothetical protein